MRQIEITVRLNEPKEIAIEKLIKQGFEKIRECDVNDVYMTNLHEELHGNNIQLFLKNAVLLRKLIIENQVIQKLTYKNKEFDQQWNVVSENKINVGCDNLDNAKRLFEYLHFKELIRVNYHVTVYKKSNKEFAFQEVENLGTLIEYENDEDFSNKTIDEINIAKKKMYNEILQNNIKLTKEMDVKKAYELIKKNIKG